MFLFSEEIYFLMQNLSLTFSSGYILQMVSLELSKDWSFTIACIRQLFLQLYSISLNGLRAFLSIPKPLISQILKMHFLEYLIRSMLFSYDIIPLLLNQEGRSFFYVHEI